MKRFILCILGSLILLNVQAQEYLQIQDGTYIPVNKIKRIRTIAQEHSRSLSKIISNNKNVSIYAEALNATGIIDSLKCYIDDNYKWASEQNRIDSCTWSNNKLCIHTAVEYDNVAYPEIRKYEHTVFLCPDSILKDKYGIESLEDLRKMAKNIYDEVYPEDALVTDETDRRNSLNRFISYHILNFYGQYYTLTAMDGNSKDAKLQYNFNRRKRDITDWYETFMPNSIMKFSFPSGHEEGLYINRRGVQSRADERGVFVRGTKVSQPDSCTFETSGVNGLYHYIDDILAYDKTTQTKICDDIIRTDCTTLSPDFMSSDSDGQTARGHYCRTSHEGGRYGDGAQGASAASNRNTCLGFKPGYVRNFEFGNNTHIHVRNRVLNFWSYQADEVTIKGKYDVKIKLPPAPSGTYEVRLGTCCDFMSRGIVAFYVDDIPQGMPIDLRPNGQVLFGNKSNRDLGNDPESIAAFDHSIHNRGWLRGPGEYEPGDRSSYGSAPPLRDLPNTIRCVVGKFTTDGKSNHYLRMQQLMESAENEMNFDFIELVPQSVYDNEDYLESNW